MSFLRVVSVLLSVGLVLSTRLSSAAQLPPVVVTGNPVAPLPTAPGTGLCLASRVSTNPSGDFPQSNAGFTFGVNTFLDASPDDSNPNARVTSVLQTLLDLSNNNTAGQRQSFGDFENVAPGCQVGGCDFFVNDTTTSFATRLRGYFRVSSDMVGLPVHFGFYADDAVALTLYDRQSRAYPVINRPPLLGTATWRTTNSVTFLTPGLYPVELVYAEITEHAALEMSVFVGSFSDFERGANQTPIIKLKEAGFSLVSPASLYQSESGQPAYSDPGACVQCNRQYANSAGNNGCDPGYYCNGAALCDMCDSNFFCGSSCSPCGGRTPFCAARARDHVCVECRQSTDCTAPDACHVGVCDASGTCTFPAASEGTVCPGGTCRAGTCVSSTPTNPDGGGVNGDGGGASEDGGVGSPPDGSSPGMDGGAPGGGSGGDGGAGTGVNDGNECADPRPVGCGCGTASPPLAPLALLGFAFLLRRIRRARAS